MLRFGWFEHRPTHHYLSKRQRIGQTSKSWRRKCGYSGNQGSLLHFLFESIEWPLAIYLCQIERGTISEIIQGYSSFDNSWGWLHSWMHAGKKKSETIESHQNRVGFTDWNYSGLIELAPDSYREAAGYRAILWPSFYRKSFYFLDLNSIQQAQKIPTFAAAYGTKLCIISQTPRF